MWVVSGEVVLVTDAGEETLRAGDCAGFKAGVSDGRGPGAARSGAGRPSPFVRVIDCYARILLYSGIAPTRMRCLFSMTKRPVSSASIVVM